MLSFNKIYLLLIIIGCSCNHNSTETGQKLAETHCGGCHLFPQPKLLDKSTWQNRVLPRMALRLGYLPENVPTRDIQSDYYLLTENNLFPEKPMVSTDDWQKIYDYYIRLAPEQIDNTMSPENKTLSQFRVHVPEVKTGQLPSSTLIKHLENHGSIVASFASKKLWLIDNGSGSQHINLIPKIVSDFQAIDSNHLLVTFLGDVIRPDAPASGLIAKFELQKGKLLKATPLPLPPLYRPTQAFFTQLDNEPEKELVICQFGFYQGRFSYWKKNGQQYEEKIISKEAGALKAIARDFTEDGFIDLMVLFAHGNERISLFTNDGTGNFKENVILQFPPVFGSSSFTLADINDDGLDDIIYTCGDNADLSPITKPYHGVYIYINQANQKYKETFHHPLPGAYKAIAEDFDHDGDLDLAAVGFFVDDSNPRGFVYLEQDNNLSFNSYTSELHEIGRWIDLVAADHDGDGDKDILLANGYGLSGLDFAGEMKNNPGPPWIVLENTLNDQLVSADNQLSEK